MFPKKANPVENASSANLLYSFDFSAIEELDPSLGEGHRMIYDKELLFHIRFEENNQTQEISTEEPLRVRLFILGDENQPDQLKIQMHSDNDLFFNYNHKIDANGFKRIKQEQQLHVEFKEYPGIVIKSINRVETDPNQYVGVFTILSEGRGKLDILQTTEYKNIELISFDFEVSDEEEIRQQITFKYGSLKSKLALMEGRLGDINDLLRVKNPSLLLQLQKGGGGGGSRVMTGNASFSKK